MPNGEGIRGEGRLRQIVEAMPVAAYTTDRDGLLTCFNSAAVTFAGRIPEVGKDRWCVSWRLYTLDGTPLPHDQCPMAITLKENRTIRGVQAISEQPGGTRIRFQPYPTPVRDTKGMLIGGFNMLVVVGADDRDRLDRRGDALPLRNLLRGNLETIVSIVEDARTSCGSSMQAKAALSLALQRITALSAAQGMLLGSDPHMRIDGWDLLSTACMIARRRVGSHIDLTCEASAHDLDIESATTLALIVHELVAYMATGRCAAHSAPALTVGLHRAGGAWLLSVRDDATSARAPEGVGLGFVHALARLLNGTFAFETATGACTVRFLDARGLH
jgi:two-component sensor histidine kinase